MIFCWFPTHVVRLQIGLFWSGTINYSINFSFMLDFPQQYEYELKNIIANII